MVVLSGVDRQTTYKSKGQMCPNLKCESPLFLGGQLTLRA